MPVVCLPFLILDSVEILYYVIILSSLSSASGHEEETTFQLFLPTVFNSFSGCRCDQYPATRVINISHCRYFLNPCFSYSCSSTNLRSISDSVRGLECISAALISVSDLLGSEQISIFLDFIFNFESSAWSMALCDITLTPFTKVFQLFSTVITISKLYYSALEFVLGFYILTCIHSTSIALDVRAYAQHLVLLCSSHFHDCGVCLPDKITSKLIKWANCLPALLSLLFEYCRLRWKPYFIKEYRTDFHSLDALSANLPAWQSTLPSTF